MFTRKQCLQFESQGQNGANQNQPWHILARPLFPCKQGKQLQLTLCACTSRWTTIRKTKIVWLRGRYNVHRGQILGRWRVRQCSVPGGFLLLKWEWWQERPQQGLAALDTHAWTKGESGKGTLEGSVAGVQREQLEDGPMKHSADRRREQRWWDRQRLAVFWERSSPGVLLRRKIPLRKGNTQAHNKEPPKLWPDLGTLQSPNPGENSRRDKSSNLSPEAPSDLPGHVRTGQSWLPREPYTFPFTDFDKCSHLRQIATLLLHYPHKRRQLSFYSISENNLIFIWDLLLHIHKCQLLFLQLFICT